MIAEIVFKYTKENVMKPIVVATTGGDDSCNKGFFDYVLKIFVVGGSPEVEVKASITFNGALELLVKKHLLNFHSLVIFTIFFMTQQIKIQECEPN